MHSSLSCTFSWIVLRDTDSSVSQTRSRAGDHMQLLMSACNTGMPVWHTSPMHRANSRA